MSAASSLELKVPPLVVVLLAMLAMWLLGRTGLHFDWLVNARMAGALLLLAAGLLCALAGVLEFRKARTTVNPMQPGSTSSMVRSGIYRHTRNPMYLGMLLGLTGWAVWLAGIGPWLVLPAFVLYMNRFQIEPEERALAVLFGDEFVEYRRLVRRWL